MLLTKLAAKHLIQTAKMHTNDNDEQLADFAKKLTKTEIFYLILTTKVVQYKHKRIITDIFDKPTPYMLEIRQSFDDSTGKNPVKEAELDEAVKLLNISLGTINEANDAVISLALIILNNSYLAFEGNKNKLTGLGFEDYANLDFMAHYADYGDFCENCDFYGYAYERNTPKFTYYPDCKADFALYIGKKDGLVLLENNMALKKLLNIGGNKSDVACNEFILAIQNDMVNRSKRPARDIPAEIAYFTRLFNYYNISVSDKSYKAKTVENMALIRQLINVNSPIYDEIMFLPLKEALKKVKVSVEVSSRFYA